MSNSLWTTLKKIGINLPISPSNPLLHPSVHDYPIKKMCSVLPETLMSFWFYLAFEQRKQEKKDICLSRTVLLLTFTFSLISELSRGFAALPVCFGVNGLFLFQLFWLVLFLMLSSAFILFIIILICVHTRFFFFEERLVIHPAIHSFVVHYLPFYLIYKQDVSKMRLWQGTQI